MPSGSLARVGSKLVSKASLNEISLDIEKSKDALGSITDLASVARLEPVLGKPDAVTDCLLFA